MIPANAGCKAQDIAHLQQHIGNRCQVVPLPERALLALQGPAAVTALAALLSLVAAAVSHRWIEEPFVRRARALHY